MRRTDGDDEVSEDTGHPDQTVLGIDLGVNSLAVSSTGTFWQGDDYDHWCREFEKRRGEMQHCGTQAAHKALCFASGSVKKHGGNSTSTRSQTNSSRKPSNTTAM